MLCFATHDRNRLASRLMGSVGSDLIQRTSESFIVVGPHGAFTASGNEVAVALDGVGDQEPLLSVGVKWANRVRAPLRIITVFEPTPADLRRPEHYGPPWPPDRSGRVPRCDPATVNDTGLVGVETTAVPDPVSVAGSLETHFADHPALLLVMGGGRHREWPPSSAEHPPEGDAAADPGGESPQVS